MAVGGGAGCFGGGPARASSSTPWGRKGVGGLGKSLCEAFVVVVCLKSLPLREEAEELAEPFTVFEISAHS